MRASPRFRGDASVRVPRDVEIWDTCRRRVGGPPPSPPAPLTAPPSRPSPFAGYAPKYRAVENAIKAKYPKTECVGEPTPNTSGAFEVVVDGNQVHSKLNGDGHVDSPEKLEKILAAIGAAQ